MSKVMVTSAKELIASGMNVNSLRTNALLRKDEWLQLDEVVVDIAKKRLNGIADLQARGLTLNLGGLGTMVSQYEAQSDMTDANVDMAGVTPGEEDDVTFDLRSVPVPITHKDFRINIRRLEASRKLGDSIDVTQAEVASRKVAEKLESMLFNGVGVTVEGSTIYGYTNHPRRNTGVASGPFSTIGNIYATILNMIRDLNAVRMYGPFMLYVAKDVWPDFLNVYTDGSGETARDRVLRIPELMDVKPADVLTNGHIVMVQMTRDVVDLAVGQDIVTVQWNALGGMIEYFKVMAAMAPRIKYDSSNRMGIAHYTGASTPSGS